MREGTGWKVVASLAVAALWSVAALAGEGGGVSADQALKRLLDGNGRYVANQMTIARQSHPAVREVLANAQHPHAVILSCSDSRVPPEIVFDQGLGELFVIRVAGNVPDPIVLGSIEYAAEHLGSPLLVVLGHERCGAVTAAVEASGEPEGNIGAIVRKIEPAVQKARAGAEGKERSQLVDAAVDENVRLVAASLTRDSAVLGNLVNEGKLKIVAAKYDLDDGTVKLLDGK